MNERFRYCLKKVLKHEGGFTDNPNDRGGKTNFGITQRVYEDFCIKRKLPERDVKFIHESEVEIIYYSEYWLLSSCDKLPEPLDLFVFDFAVHSGSHRAVRTLQQCLGVTADGRIGRQTIGAIAAISALGDLDDLCSRYLTARADFLSDIFLRDKTQQVFLRGWLNRIASLKKEMDTA